MAVATLHFTPYIWQRTEQLPKRQQTELASAVSKTLYNKFISSPESCEKSLEGHPDLAWIRAFISAYTRDLAEHVLHCLVDNPSQSESYWNEESRPEKAVRSLTLRIVQRLVRTHITTTQDSNTGSALDLSSLVNLAIAYAADYPKTIGNAFSDLFLSSPGLATLFKNELIPSLRKSLENITSHSTSVLACKTTCIISHILKCISSGHQAGPITAVFINDTGFIEAIAMAYSVCHLNYSKLSDTSNLDGQRWLRAKIELVDTLHAIIQSLLHGLDDRDVLFEVLSTLLRYESSSNSKPVESHPSSLSMSPLGTQSVLHDYEYAFMLSQTLMEAFGSDHEDPRVYPIISSLRELVPQRNEKRVAGLLVPFLENRKAVSKSHVSEPHSVKESGNGPLEPSLKPDKGKGKAIDVEPSTSALDLDLAVSQILDIFPDQPVETVRRYLEHPSFQGDTEKVIAALLEGNMPPDLSVHEPTETSANYQLTPEVEFKYTKDRRNIWDDMPMDESKLRIGRVRNDDADDLINDRSFIEQMKADILRRVQELSDEDEEEYESGMDKRKGKTVISGPTFLDDDVVTVKVVGDGEPASDSESEDESEAVIAPETILEMAYIDNPKLFDRDAATRRSKARADLKAKTGWADEQIEGWRIMLERNPKKDKILQKHEFSGNKPLSSQASASNSRSDHQVSEQSGSAARGARGRGRGGGRGGRGGQGGQHQQGEASSSLDQHWKDKNKSRTANHNRKRGHDKKMARGGGGGLVG